MNVFIAEYTSRHFYFEAYGTTEQEAVTVMCSVLADHAIQRAIDADWYNAADIVVREIKLGEGYRDGRKISARRETLKRHS